MEAATIMSPRVRGTLDGQDHADTYALFRKPGQYRYELEVRGEGAVSLLLEAFRPGGGTSPESIAGWQVLAEQPSAPAGSRVSGSVTVPEASIAADSKVDWVRLRLRISRTVPTQSVEYEFYLDPGDHGPAPAPQRTG
jgi:hypothetical protein